jgi:hypothetical protein
MELYSQNSKNEIYGIWRIETANGKKVESVIDEYIFFENGKMLYLGNSINDNGIQISDEFIMRIQLFDFIYENDLLFLNETYQTKATIEDNYLTIEISEEEILKLRKITKNRDIRGIWKCYMEEHIYYQFDIDNNLSSKVSNSLDDVAEDVLFTFEETNILDIIFDGYYSGNDGKIINYFLLDEDRIIILEIYGNQIIPDILIKE